MAQSYKINLKRYNGVDYDTLKPTPASHASTHKSTGDDPLTIGTNELENGAVTYAKTSGIQAKHKTATVTLESGKTSWSKVTTGVTATNTVIVTPHPDSFTLWRNYGVRCSGQSNGTLTFTADSAFSSGSITVNVLIFD